MGHTTYDPKEKTLTRDGVTVGFYCGHEIDKYSSIFVALIMGDCTPIEAFEEFKTLRASCPLTVDDIQSAIKAQLEAALTGNQKRD